MLFVLILATMVVAPSREAAHACSCVAPNQGEDRVAAAERQVDASDGAIVGTLVSKTDGRDVNDPSRYHYQVGRRVKGDIGAEVDVWSASNGAMCGLETAVGQRTGLYLTRSGDRWTSSLCATEDPDVMMQVKERPTASAPTTTRPTPTTVTTRPTPTTSTAPTPPSTEPLPTTTTIDTGLATARIPRDGNNRGLVTGLAVGAGLLGVAGGVWRYRVRRQ
jgi:hypothetical protein